MRFKGSAENTTGKRFRTLRAVFNLAIEQGIVKAEILPI
ncbi:MAG: phage integrase SAM-like domain-containing protein [Alistipes indistinctus]